MARPIPPVNMLFALPLALGLLSGCSFVETLPGGTLFDSPRQLRGHLVDDATLAQVTVGVSSRADVETLLGSPSATGTFDDSVWYYMSSVTRQRHGRFLSVQDQRATAIHFDPAGVVREVKRIGPEDGRDVAVVDRVTASPGNDRTFLQQLFGNLGRLAPGVGAQGNQTVGGPSPSGR